MTTKCKLYRFGSYNSLESDIARQFPAVHFIPVASGKLRRYWDWDAFFKNVADMVKVIWWFFQSLWYLKKYKIQKVFCKWWYVALPVSFAAKMLGIPILVHESDTHIGLTNKLVWTLAWKRYSWFPWTFPNERVVGQILSHTLRNPTPIELPNFDQQRTTLIVIWWSQWSNYLLTIVEQLCVKYPLMQFLVVLGLKNKQQAERFVHQNNIWTFDFLQQKQLAYLYQLADLACTRWSATTLAELHWFGVKKIIVPLPYTWWNHQEINADRYVEQYNDYKILQTDQPTIQAYTAIIDQYQWYKKPSSLQNGDFTSAHTIIWADLLE